LRKFFIDVLGVPQEEADVAACKMEHSLDDAILTKFVQFVEGLNTQSQQENFAPQKK
jgi:Mn-dependent DtxR family transcriptional regulator